MGTALHGSRCGECATTTYPRADTCPRCGSAAADVVLTGEGTLWSWTVQRFAPKSPPYVAPPGGFVPFALGYVELPEGVRVAAVFDEEDLADGLVIGAAVRIAAGDGVPRGRLVQVGAS
ncbi:MAG TPA: OB-fold domain-containing protein [Actinospica sp.]|nr:OB-fold domain-containing protein [Actinospica sp.]